MTSATLPDQQGSGAQGVPEGGAPVRRRTKVVVWLLVTFGLLGLLGALAGIKASQIGMLIGFGKQMQKMGPPPETVSTAPVAEQNWDRTLNAVASVVSSKGVSVSNDAAGVVSRIYFESGASVRQGQVLVELDTSVERAQLASVRARQKLAQTSLERSQKLIGSGVIPTAQLDADEATFKSAQADAAALVAQIERKTIRAPFSGKLGLRAVNLGQYLSPGTTVALLEAPDSEFVDFTLPQQNLPLLHVGMAVRASEEGGHAPEIEGSISAISPSLDAMTRSVQLRATFPDHADALRPGMFLRVAVVLAEGRQVLVIPQTAVLHASYGDSVFVVDEAAPESGGPPRKVARQQFVRLGDKRGDLVAVADGLTAGQSVVTAGAFKLRNGLPLNIDNQSVKLDPKLDPHPENH